MKQNRLADIAKKLKLSPSTVSRALSDHPDISDKTKKKVKDLAEKLHYTPNPFARSLKKNQTSTIGVLVPEIKHDFFSSAISGIEEVAYQSGYTIILSQSNESFEREVVNTYALMNHRVAGILVSISQDTVNSDHFRFVIDNKIPIVFFDRYCEDISANKVVIDDEKSAYNAVMHLIAKGYKNIAHFAGPDKLEISRNRLKGYKTALMESGLKLEEDLILSGGLHESDGYNSMDTLVRRGTVPDAVFCVNDPVAVGAFQRIKEEGIKIPEQIGLVGFSNNKITALLDPPLTTVNQPSFEMGKKAAEILIGMIETPGEYMEVKTHYVETDLIIRKST